MARPWNGWYHAITTCYGTWLRGDGRGWRARHHREHVDGDYTHPPPPGTHQHVLERSQRALRHSPIVLPTTARQLVCEAMVHRLAQLQTELLVLSVASTHAHAVCRFARQSPDMAMRGFSPNNTLRDGRDPIPRHVIAMAMKHASHEMRQWKLKRPGPLWAKRAKLVPIRSRHHQLEAVKYVYRHRHAEGAAVWSKWRGFEWPV